MAIKFKYSMESILQYRQYTEDEKKMQLAKFTMELNKEKQGLVDLQNSIESAVEQKLSKVKYNVSDEIMFVGHMESFERKLVKQRATVVEAERKVERARKELEEATKDRKIMESLGEKEFNRFVADLDAKEAKELDDMVTTRFNRA